MLIFSFEGKGLLEIKSHSNSMGKTTTAFET